MTAVACDAVATKEIAIIKLAAVTSARWSLVVFRSVVWETARAVWVYVILHTVQCEDEPGHGLQKA